MIDDDPEELLGEIFQREFFASDPLGLSIPGTPETVRSFDHQTTRAYHERCFAPSNLVIAAAGNLEHAKLAGLVNSTFVETQRPLRTLQSARWAVNDRWEMKITGPNAFERSYTLEGTLGQHEPPVVAAIVSRMIPTKT